MALTIAILLVVFLWISHRLHDAYVHAVSREERKLRPQWYARLRRAQFGGRPQTHFGPKIFLALDFLAACGLAWVLCRIHPVTREADLDDPRGIIRILPAVSLAYGLWLVLEGRRLQSFYQHMMRSVKVLRGEVVRLAFDDELLGRAAGRRRSLMLAALAWTALPHLLLALDLDPLARAESAPAIAGGLLVWFAAPLGLLGALVGGYLFRLRATLYS